MRRAFPICCVSLVALFAACSDSTGTIPTAGQNGNVTNGVTGGGGGAPGGSGGATAGNGGAAIAIGGGGAGGAPDTAGSGGAIGTAGTSGDSGAAVGFSRPKGVIPSKAYPASMVNLAQANWKNAYLSLVPIDNKIERNFPSVINGYLQLSGSGDFSLNDISDPAAPKRLSHFISPDPNKGMGMGASGIVEAESHEISFARYGDSFYAITIAGAGIDIWNVTDPTNPLHLRFVKLEGVYYGDFTAAVWGVSWQGDTIYVGGTDTGLHILDAKDPNNVTVLKRVPTSSFGGVSAGRIWAIGNILVITTPKESGGIATLDISDPVNPVTLDAIVPSPKSYSVGFFRHNVFMAPSSSGVIRTWDVLSDPTKIGSATAPLSTLAAIHSEYMSFSDNNLFLGHATPNPGATRVDVTDPKNMVMKNRIWGRMDASGADDQFVLAVGNLLVVCDDQLPIGCLIGVHTPEADTKPPAVDTIIPKDGATGQSTKSRVGITFTDNLELATVNAASFIVRPMGGQTLAGKWTVTEAVLNFYPDQALSPKTTYEVVLPKGGITDFVGNAIAQDFKATFTTQ